MRSVLASRIPTVKWSPRIFIVLLWLWIGIIGNLPPCWLVASTGFVQYAWPMASLHGPYFNHHTGFPFLHMDMIDVDALGGITLHFVYWKLIFDLVFLATSTGCLFIVIRQRRQLSIGMLLVLTGFVAVTMAVCKYLNDQFAARALISTALYSLPILYCMVSLFKRNCTTCTYTDPNTRQNNDVHQSTRTDVSSSGDLAARAW